MPNRRSFLILPLLAALPALAAEPTFGFQGLVGMPTGTFGDADHLDRRLGLGVGFQVPVDFGGGHVLKPKLDYLALRRDNGGIRYRADALLLMVDYNYHFDAQRQGAYLIGGVGIHSTRRDVARSAGLASASVDATSNGFAYDLGLGYAFNPNVSVELKYLGLNQGDLAYKQGGGSDAGFMAGTVVASVGVTF